jgi:IS5 family transposase
LQHLYNLGDDELEFQIRDRYTFCRFLGLSPEGRIPDAKTIWLFREQLGKAENIKSIFEVFEAQLEAKGYKARKGQIIDASFIEAPRQRNSREENAQIKAGEIPESLSENPHVLRQKDTDARWTKKRNEVHYGYKNHVAVDAAHKLIRNYAVTSAEVHDSNVFVELLSKNTSREVWADSAYSSTQAEKALAEADYRSHVHRKGSRNHPLSKRSEQANKKKSKTRVRVEHVFGSMENEQGGMFVRVIGLVRATAKVGLMNLAYNMRRLVSLNRMKPSYA